MKDIYLKPTPAGPDFDILSTGLPRMTGGLENYIYLLLTMCAWWGNDISEEGETFSSNLFEIMASRPLTNKTRLDILEEARRLLYPLTFLGMADSVDVEGVIPSVGVLYLSVKVLEPERDDADRYVYSLNWDLQEIGIINQEYSS